MASNVTEILRRTLGCEKFPEMLPYMKRIDETEERFTAVGRLVEKYSAGLDKLSQKGENLCSSLGACSSHLLSGDEVKNHLSNYAMYLSAVQQQRTELKDVLQDKISADILSYEGKCQEMRKSVKICEDALRKKNHRLHDLAKAKNKVPLDPRRINAANIKFEQSRYQARRCEEDIKVEMLHFERKKLEDFNRVLADFLLAEMRFHAQALQEYTAAFRCLPLLSAGSNDTGDDHDDGDSSCLKSRERKIAFHSSDEVFSAKSQKSGRGKKSDSSDSPLSIGDLY